MSKKTLLKLVQDILSEMDSDEVNSISDTVESLQVANIVKTCFEELITNRNWPQHRKIVQLEAANDVTKPNYLKLPDSLKELSMFRYECQKFGDTKTTLRDVKYLEPHQFLQIVSLRNSDSSLVETVLDFSGSKLLVINNVSPTYWTSFDDTYLVTDSYDKDREATLQRSKSQALAFIIPTFLLEDDYVPDLPIDAFPLLFEEAKSTAFVTLKQSTNPKAEQKASRQNRWLSRKAWRAAGGVSYDDYGRKSRR